MGRTHIVFAVAALSLGMMLPCATAGICLTYSNEFGELGELGPGYADVTLTGLHGGGVEVSVTVNSDIYDALGGNFGLDKFAFHIDADIAESDLDLPGSWNAKQNKNFSEFGKFAWSLSGPGARVRTLTFSVSGITIDHFIGNGPTAGSGYTFAAHIGGFENDSGVESHFVAGFFQNPAPSAALLGVLGLSGLTVARRRLI